MRQRLCTASPRHVALAMLDARFGDRESAFDVDGLTAFQQDALTRVRSILRQRHGAILADSVGLGKTHIAAALIRDVSKASGAVLVCGPPVLQAHWRRHLRRVRSWQWCSHASLSRGRVPVSDAGWRLVVVDEAHAFRNPRTQRYRALRRVCGEADVLLLSATPVNNTLHDFYHLIRLFADDVAFHDVGVPDLRAAFDAAASANDSADVRRVAEAVMVRRTRAFITRNYPAGDRNVERALRFPESSPVRALRYDLDDAYAGGVEALLRMVMTLRFPAHTITGDLMTAALLRLGLLKRLESGSAAFRASLTRYLRLLNAVDGSLARGFVLDAREFRALVELRGGASQLLLDGAVLRRAPEGFDVRAARAEIAAEEAALRGLLGRCDGAGSDPKSALLRPLLRGALASERVLVFTEFKETAAALWRALRDEFRTALIHGTDAYLGANRAARRGVIERFAPFANGVRAPAARERVDILIATDVLAEGLNLQDARVVVSYDLPWNPVRLAQRTGRIDRLGSPHERIEAITFVPDRRLEAMLGLVRRLRDKLRAIRLVGGDAPVFAPSTKANSDHRVAARPNSARIRASFAADRPEWEIVEALRFEHRRACAEGSSSSIDCVPVARLVWTEARAVVLCCVARRGTTRIRLIDHGGIVRDGDPAIDRALLRALRCHEPTAPADLKRVHRMAQVALQDAGLPRARASERTRRHAATVVHRWLSTRPLGPSDADYARADRLLERLERGGVAITRAALPMGTLESRLEQLETAVSRLHYRREPVEAEKPRLIAILELVPSDAGC